ncbi:hypothetical protein EWZ76_05285 [Helicobacter pylori]|nr:hypothetical protein [Helicobacter pylori]
MNAKNMVKERPEEARNSPKGNFYFFFSSLGELWRALALFFCFFILSCFIIVLLKFQNNV